MRGGLRGDVELLAVRDQAQSLRRLRHALTPADLRAGRSVGNRQRRRSRLLARALLRMLAGRLHGCPPKRTQLRLTSNRRPRDRTIDGRQLALSATHGGGWVIAAATRGASAGRRLGIDVEPRDRVLSSALAARLRRLHGAPEGTAMKAEDWCCVEAVLKADGRGVPALGQLQLRSGSAIDGTALEDGTHRTGHRACAAMRATMRDGLEGFAITPLPRVALGLVGALASGS